ncbi:hypothetical protein INR49_031990 [Caranx melampygus]|nr:hypothetical protein INR49_031990 [Caranx melampygus]
MSFLTGAQGDYVTFICVSVTNTRPHQLLVTKVKQFGGSSSFTKRSQWTVEKLRQVNGINPNKWVASSSADKCIFVQVLYHACQTYWEGKARPLDKVGKLVKQSPQGRLSHGAHRDTGAGPIDSSPGSASRTLQVRRKSYVPPRQTEFINCQSKLTGDARTMNLLIYRCKAFLNRMRKMIVAKQRPSPGQHFTGTAISNVIQRVNVALGERGDRLTHAEDKTVELMRKAQQFADSAHKLALKYSK